LKMAVPIVTKKLIRDLSTQILDQALSKSNFTSVICYREERIEINRFFEFPGNLPKTPPPRMTVVMMTKTMTVSEDRVTEVD
jgi:hypothetical protein